MRRVDEDGERAGTRTGRRSALTAIATITLTATALIGCAAPDYVPGPDQPRDCVPRLGTNQVILPLPGLFLPLPSIKGYSEFDDLEAAAPDLDLPDAVELRDNTQGFNWYAEFVLRDGSLYTRPRDPAARAAHPQWRKVVTPSCLDGNILSVSVDSNMAVALDSDGWIYSLDNLLSGPMLWNWTRSFGAPIWLWPGQRVPEEGRATGRWSISHRMSTSFIDAKGYDHPLTAGLVQLVTLTGDGSRIVFMDPWLPADYSYEIGGPVGGRFISESISGSGSVTFVMNRFGDMYTRNYDLDLAGSNFIPSRYTWQEQGDKPTAPNQLEERFDDSCAAIALPAQEWQHQPKIPGEVTARISISQTGAALEDRELRVEGRRDGVTGYWHKGISEAEWAFTATGTPLIGQILTGADPLVDQSASTLAALSGVDFEGDLVGGWSASTTDFDWAQTVHPVTLTSPSGNDYQIALYTTDGLRQDARGPGLDWQSRFMDGAIDLRGAAPTAPGNEELVEFMRAHLGGKDIAEVWVQASSDSLLINPAIVFSQPLGTLWRR